MADLPIVGNKLSKKLGPLPVWGWGIVVVGGAAAGYFLFRGKGSGAATSSRVANVLPGSSAVPSGGGGGGGSFTSGRAPSPVAGGGGPLLAIDLPEVIAGGIETALDIPSVSPAQASPSSPNFSPALSPTILPAIAKAVAPTPKRPLFVAPSIIPAWARNAPANVRRAFGLPVEAVAADAVRDIQQAGTNTAARTIPNPAKLSVLAAEGIFFDPRNTRKVGSGPGAVAEQREAANRTAATSPGGFNGVGGLEIAANEILSNT